MTTYNKTTLATFFKTGDVPKGPNYADLIDSNVNLVETAAQSMAGPLYATEFVTPKVSAANVTITGTVSAPTIAGTTLTLGGTATIVGDVIASAATVYASALRANNGAFYGVAIISAAGTTQATATELTGIINRGQGVADGTTTGFVIQANRTGLVQYIINEGTVSANLWPPTGGTINALSANAAYAMAASTMYTIIHKSASAYAVK